MEFFKIVDVVTTESELQDSLSLEYLEGFSNQLFNLGKPTAKQSTIGGVWGEFTLSREKIKGGLRFALLECPNALCWTLTTGYPPDRDALVVHLTINRQQKKQEFLDEIEDFLEDHVVCLETFFQNKRN